MMNDDFLQYYLEMDKKYEKYKPKLLKCNEILFKMDDVEEKVRIIKDLYAYMKEISTEFYSEEKNEFVCFENLIQLLCCCEETLGNKCIIDISTNSNQHNTSKKEENIVNEIVNLTRKSLLNLLTMNGSYSHPFDFYDLENYCEISCDNTISICNDMSIKCSKIKIPYGFTNNLLLFNGKGFHCFTILEINKTKYLVDCTYKQFFLLKKCILDRIGIPCLGGCYAGSFMLMTDRRRKVAEKILKDGWILLTEEVFKDYMDGFMLSWRNGIYYELIQDFSYKTPYTAEDYWRFLNEKDDLLNYEKRLTLGFQEMPLKNPKCHLRNIK